MIQNENIAATSGRYTLSLFLTLCAWICEYDLFFTATQTESVSKWIYVDGTGRHQIQAIFLSSYLPYPFLFNFMCVLAHFILKFLVGLNLINPLFAKWKVTPSAVAYGRSSQSASERESERERQGKNERSERVKFQINKCECNEMIH